MPCCLQRLHQNHELLALKICDPQSCQRTPPTKTSTKTLAGWWFSPKRRKKREKKNVHQIVVTSPMWKNNMVSKFNVHPFVRPKCFVWDSPFPRSQIVPIELGYATFKKKHEDHVPADIQHSPFYNLHFSPVFHLFPLFIQIPMVTYGSEI